MMLLEPAAAVVAGAVAIPALAVLYLLKLRRRPVRVSSTLLWQQAYEDLEANIPWRWVRPSWLVLLHLLLVVLLVLAIGRPTIGASGSAPSKMVVILDRSASMNATDGVGGGTRFDEARRRALRVIDDAMSLARNVQAAVIGAACEPVALTPLTTDRRLLRAAVEAAGATDQPLDLGAAIELANGMVGAGDDVSAESAPAARPPLVVVFSDGSVGGSDAAVPPGIDVRLERVGPSPVGLVSAGSPDAAMGVDNLGIVALSARRGADNPATVRVFAEVLNASRRTREVPCVLVLDGVEQARRALMVPAATDDGPGVASATFELATRRGGVVELVLVTQDVLKADDRGWLVLTEPKAPAILLVAPGEPSSAPGAPPITPGWVLENVLAELRPAVLRTVVGDQSAGAVAGAAGIYDLIVFDRVEPTSVPPVPSIVLGAAMPSAGVTRDGPWGTVAERDFVLAWDRSHPLLRDVSLDSVFTVGGSLSTAPSAAGVLRTDLAVGASGPLIVLMEAGGTRHVLAPDLEHSNWGLQVGFAIFLANAVDYLTLDPQERSGLGRRIADPIEVTVARAVTTLRVEGPSPRQITLPAASWAAVDGAVGRAASIGRVDRVGVYTLPAGVSPPVLGVNLVDATESAVATADRLAVRARGGVSGPGSGPAVAREISRELLLAAMVVLVIEWIVFARSARS